ncbi:DUF6497 family protein [Marivita sp. GX14005]|uniref:DUF6497 family protein n=1 Tax=Marivita sp. GX14005 TaxID=2942276 RepID=UPI0020191D1E|nr:DUF6497 family protein [Marivita sp. GX14005]MCL3883686.1 DUF6497 family protein [Marivita sp. GX14005]
MITYQITILISAIAYAVTVFDGLLSVPSGQPVTFQEMIAEPPVYRFRFVAPQIGDAGRAYEDVEGDMRYLCETYALPHLGVREGAQIVISLARRETEFGVAEPDVTQFFEAYRAEGGSCILEIF